MLPLQQDTFNKQAEALIEETRDKTLVFWQAVIHVHRGYMCILVEAYDCVFYTRCMALW